MLATITVNLPARPAFALDPGKLITQYGHMSWRIADGQIGSIPVFIAQTTDGYLWVSTVTGLYRFDGVRFVAWRDLNRPPLPDDDLGWMLGSRDGSLWMRTGQGLARWHDNTLTYFPPETGFGDVREILEDRDGRVWVVGTGGGAPSRPVCAFDSAAFHCYGAKDGVGFEGVTSIYQDRQGAYWLGGPGGAWRWRPGPSMFFPTRAGDPAARVGLQSIRSDWRGSLVASSPQLGLFELSANGWTRYQPTADLAVHPETLLTDRHGALWVGTRGEGLLRITRDRVDRFTEADGLSGGLIFGMFEDREGNIWLTTTGGIDCFREKPIVALTEREGLSSEVSSVALRQQGGVWMGGYGSLDAFVNGTWMHLGPKYGLSRYSVAVLTDDPTTGLWVSAGDHLVLLDKHGGVTRQTLPDGSPTGHVSAFVEDRSGDYWMIVRQTDGGTSSLVRVPHSSRTPEIVRSALPRYHAFPLSGDPAGGVWLGSPGRLELLRDGRVVQTYTVSDGIPDQPIRAGIFGRDGSLWVGGHAGVTRVSRGTSITLSQRNGLACDRVLAMTFDAVDALWLHTTCGLIRIAARDLDNWRTHPEGAIASRLFDTLDGANPDTIFATPRVTTTPDGKLWFPNVAHVEIVDPQALSTNTRPPPPVVIESVVADDRVVSPGAAVRLPSRTMRVQIDYTALSFSVPQRVRFRTRLEGLDADWQDAGTRRQTSFTNLRPGRYRFHVIASNSDGVWNTSGASLDVEITPAFYQTLWFRAAIIAVVAGAAWSLHRLRLRQVAARLTVRLEERVAERTRIARDLHDTLLQSFQGLILRFQAAAGLVLNDPMRAREALDIALDHADRAIVEGRDAVQWLRISRVAGNLADALRSMCDDLGVYATAALPVVVEGQPRGLHPLVHDEVYWIAREALTNACKHASASTIETTLSYTERGLRLAIRDDGDGIDPTIVEAGFRSGHFGLPGMRERAERIGARFEIANVRHAGVHIELFVPAVSAYRRTIRSGFLLFSKREERYEPGSPTY